MAEAIVSMALGSLGNWLGESRLLSGVSGEVKALQTRLKEIQCLLKDADRRRCESESVANWLAQIRSLAHRAEDAVDTYAVEVSSYRGPMFLHRFFRLLKERALSLEISEINSEIARVTKSMQEYGIRSIICRGESSTVNHSNDERSKWLQQTFPYEIEDCFVGKDEELEQLVSLIVDDKEHRVVAIWGMGGIGKTTIARKVYNHGRTRRCFERFAWVCITQQCQIRTVLEDVLKQLNPEIKREDASSLSHAELIEQLREIQQAKRCVVVLDDVWETDDWDGLKHAFVLQGSQKSKVMVTTRKQNVADMGFAFELGLLGVDDSLELLKKRAFPHSNIPTDFAFDEKLLQKIGKEMVRKCGYLPLVISLLGGVLSKKKSIDEWELVNENISAYLYRNSDIEKENEIHGVLNLSYEDLPYHLKPCFLYMSLFREGETIRSHILYRFWIAQGMISLESQGKDETLMDIAESYLSELASRCIVQVQVEEHIPKVKYQSCKLHDVVRELCLSKGKKAGFGLQILDYHGEKLHEPLPGVDTRHLVINFYGEVESDEFTTIPPDEDASKHTRSLIFRSQANGRTIEFPRTAFDFPNFKFVKVLVFVRLSFAGRRLPGGIDKLIHLRILWLQQCELDELPLSIGNLVHLYSLDLVNSKNVRVPNVFKKMSRLKHLYLPTYDKEKIGNYRLELDESLGELETLCGFDSIVHELTSITRMKSLRLLAAVVRDNEILSAILNAVATNWKNLRKCTVLIRQGCQFTSMEGQGSMSLTNVFTCPNLHQLSISNVQIAKLLEECAEHIMVSKLVYLHLSDCEIEDDPIRILEKLPCLEELRLEGTSFVGEEMKCHASGFPRLQQLLLLRLLNLREWRVEQGAMPILSEIEIHNCPHLKMIPDGLQFIRTLQKLTISGTPELGKRVSDEGGEDSDKIRHIPSIIRG